MRAPLGKIAVSDGAWRTAEALHRDIVVDYRGKALIIQR